MSRWKLKMEPDLSFGLLSGSQIELLADAQDGELSSSSDEAELDIPPVYEQKELPNVNVTLDTLLADDNLDFSLKSDTFGHEYYIHLAGVNLDLVRMSYSPKDHELLVDSFL